MAIFEELSKVYKGKRVLVTGDTGFKGSWMCIWLREMGAEVWGYALPPQSERDNYVTTGLGSKIRHQDGDIRDLAAFQEFFNECRPEIAFHMAAQPLVIDSYKDPRYNFETNVMGTVNFFEAVRGCSSVKCAVNITTDKCYENNEWVWGYRENDPMGGSDPYSSSKACSELITQSYIRSFFKADNTAHLASARAGNVIGGGDWAANRIVPDLMRGFLSGNEVVIRNPSYVRPWQFVLEPVYGYLKLAAALLQEGKRFSGGWNFGPSAYESYSVGDVAGEVKKHVPALKVKLSEVASGVHEAGQLRLDISKAVNFLRWTPRLDFEETIAYTVKGYLSDIESGKSVYDARVGQIKDYCS